MCIQCAVCAGWATSPCHTCMLLAGRQDAPTGQPCSTASDTSRPRPWGCGCQGQAGLFDRSRPTLPASLPTVGGNAGRIGRLPLGRDKFNLSRPRVGVTAGTSSRSLAQRCCVDPKRSCVCVIDEDVESAELVILLWVLGAIIRPVPLSPGSRNPTRLTVSSKPISFPQTHWCGHPKRKRKKNKLGRPKKNGFDRNYRNYRLATSLYLRTILTKSRPQNYTYMLSGLHSALQGDRVR